MALVRCRECKAKVSDKADKCPHCGISRPGSSPAKDGAIGCLSFILLAVIFSFFWKLCDSQENTNHSTNSNLKISEQLIEDRPEISNGTINSQDYAEWPFIGDSYGIVCVKVDMKNDINPNGDRRGVFIRRKDGLIFGLNGTAKSVAKKHGLKNAEEEFKDGVLGIHVQNFVQDGLKLCD